MLRRGVAGRGFRRREDLTDLALAIAGHFEELAGELDRFGPGVRLEHGEAADDFFGFSERPVGHRDLSVRETHARS